MENKNLNSHHDECMKEHERIIGLITNDSTVDDCVELALKDYYNQKESRRH